MDTLLVAGYPRSGNVWLARLLGDALDWPVVGLRGGWGTLAAEGQERPGPGRVMQAHYWPGEAGHLVLDLRKQQGWRPILVVRDPRDVLVSASAFWNWSLETTAQHMVKGPGPVDLPPWREYVEAWLREKVPIVRYEDFHRDALGELERLLDKLEETPQKPLAEVVQRQSFAAKRNEMQRNGDKYPFGREAQLQHLRRGEIDEWRSVLPSALAREVSRAWLPLLSRLGYHYEEMACSNSLATT